jgi:hypothetical protein
VHDELVVHVPAGQALDARDALNSAMPTELNGVLITGRAEVLGRAWRK